MTQKAKRGLANVNPERRREIARLGGLKVSSNQEHMAAIGQKGGASISKNKAFMSRIGKIGGAASAMARRPKV